ncbi:MAG: cation diffusion facilitator family transporter [Bifidobacterium sp.]|jgi:cobalt-zinc-cadmium efflux system protein|nr:cation diffusion facilitator family transporter [Bifidobacterium sp.]MCI1636141.1 cation diffusion facilitator family transporter [Bifidobacterium sp.]
MADMNEFRDPISQEHDQDRSAGTSAEIAHESASEALGSYDREAASAAATAQQPTQATTFGHQRRLAITLSFTAVVLVAEVIGAYITGSLALLVDAGHMLTDVAVLSASLVTAILMKKRPTINKTWGWARLEVITAAAGATVLLAVGCYALVEAVIRLAQPGQQEVQDLGLLLGFGLLGLASNIASIVILAAQHNDNMNMRAAFLEVMNDALGSVAVVISAVVMITTGWGGFDAVAGAAIAALIIPRSVKLLLDSLRVLLEETPKGLNLEEVKQHLESVNHVVVVHDLHAGTVASGLPRLTAHVVVDSGLNMQDAGRVLASMQDCLREHFPISIEHTTFQLEPEGYRQHHETALHDESDAQ